MWRYRNPVEITFGAGALDALPTLIRGRRYALVTYPDPPFASLAARLRDLCGDPLLTINDVAPNPDMRLLSAQSSRFADAADRLGVIVALGGGSVINSAKVFASAPGCFTVVERYLTMGSGADELTATPIVAVPTTAGTGSEVTSWATVWDTASGKKYSLARPDLYPEHAVVDPQLMLGMPRQLTISTGLDALSHALESLWNVNVNPLSAHHAVAAARGSSSSYQRLRKICKILSCERAWRRRPFRPASLSRTRAPPSRIRSRIRSRFTMALRTASHAPLPCPWS